MANKKLKQGIFAVKGDVVALASGKEERIDCTHIDFALETVFKQMRIAGNRPRTIEIYEYIFKQFVEVCRMEYVEDVELNKLYHYLDVYKLLPRLN